MRFLTALAVMPLLFAGGSALAQLAPSPASGWTEYTLGPTLEITLQNTVSKRGGLRVATDVNLDNIVAAKSGLWAVAEHQQVFVHWSVGAWHAVLGPPSLPDLVHINDAFEGPDGAACFLYFVPNVDGPQCVLLREGQWRAISEPQVFRDGRLHGPVRMLADTLGGVWCDGGAGHFADQPGWKVLAELPEDTRLAPPLCPWELRSRYGSYQEFYRLDSLGRIWCANTGPGGPGGFAPVVIIDPNPERPKRAAAQDSDWGRAYAVADTKGNWLKEWEAVAKAEPSTTSRARVVPYDGKRFWVILGGRQIWEVNHATLEGTLVWKSTDERSPKLEMLCKLGNAWYAFGAKKLFRLKDGTLDPVPMDQELYAAPRPAPTAGGDWLYRSSDTLWFVPNNGGPFRLVDRQSGIMIDHMYGVTTLPSGEAVAWEYDGNVAVLPKAADFSTRPPLLTPPAEGSIGQIPPDAAAGRAGCAWMQMHPEAVRSATGKIFGFPADDAEERLARWDGVSWTYLNLPERFSGGKPPIRDRDVLGNLWLFGSQNAEGKQACAKFLPDEERWQEFDDVEQVISALQPNEMLCPVYGGTRLEPVRSAKGDTIRITDKQLCVFTNGEWKRWSIPEFWKVLSDVAAAAASASPPLSPNLTRKPLPPEPERFDEEAAVTRIQGGALGLRLSSGTELAFKDGTWATVPMPWATRIIDSLGLPQIVSIDKDGAPGTRWRNHIECSYELENRCLYRTFRGERKPVFAEMPMTPLPLSDNTFSAAAGPGGWPVLFLESGLVFVPLDPFLPRFNETVETVEGNRVRIAAKDVPAGATVYWRHGWPDTKHRIVSRNGKGEIIHEENPPEWQVLEGGETQIGPFPDGQQIIEVVAADAQLHTSETLRAVIKIEAPADSVTLWARAVADAWPKHALEAEASLREKGRAGLDGLRQTLKTAPPEKAPALRRMIQIVDADRYVEAPEPSVRLPETATDTRPALETVSFGLVQDPDGRIWRVEHVENARYAVSVWTGQRWFSRPVEWGPGLWPLLAVDSAHRLWLTAKDAESPVRVFSPLGEDMLGEGTWKKYDNLRDALDAVGDSTLRFSATQHMEASPLGSLAGSPKGDLVFVTPDALHARLAGTWRRWGAAELPGALDPSTGQWRLLFDAENRLTVERRQDVLRLEGEWAVETRTKKVSPGNLAVAAFARVPAWNMQPDGLICSSFGVGALVLPKADLPSGYPSMVGCVLIDPTGTAFAQSRPEDQNCLRFHCAAVPPKTTASLATRDDGVRVIRVDKADAALRYAWHVDDGPWQGAVPDAEIALPPLPAGPHSVEVCAVNAAALPDPKPLRLEFEVAQGQVKAPEPADPDALIQQLRDGSPAEREQAAKALIDLGEPAAPKVKALLQETKDEGMRWRLETILQRLEQRSKREAGHAPGETKQP